MNYAAGDSRCLRLLGALVYYLLVSPTGGGIAGFGRFGGGSLGAAAALMGGGVVPGGGMGVPGGGINVPGGGMNIPGGGMIVPVSGSGPGGGCQTPPAQQPTGLQTPGGIPPGMSPGPVSAPGGGMPQPTDLTTVDPYLAKRRTANHPCPVCGKHYVNEGSLRKHLACHPETSQLSSSLRMWPCSVCQAVFTHESGK